MEHYFRIALWMFFLIGSLQAVPVTTPEPECNWIFNIHDVNITKLREEKCNNNLNFTSPKNLNLTMVSDRRAAVLCYMHGFEKASNTCESQNYIRDTLEFLDNICDEASVECKGESTNYQGFVRNFESFLHKLKSAV